MLKVTRMAFLFTDMTGSTALYSRVGDAAAYSFIQDHFDRLRPVVERHGGTIWAQAEKDRGAEFRFALPA